MLTLAKNLKVAEYPFTSLAGNKLHNGPQSSHGQAHYPQINALSKIFKMSAFLYTFHRGLHCLHLDDCLVENGRQLKKVASEYCGVSFIDNFRTKIHHFNVLRSGFFRMLAAH